VHLVSNLLAGVVSAALAVAQGLHVHPGLVGAGH
jgi:hypothetical protein